MPHNIQAIIADAHRQRDEFVAHGLRSLFTAILSVFGRKATAGRLA